MKKGKLLLVAFLFLSPYLTQAKEKKTMMKVIKPAAIPAAIGPAEYFTGIVKITMLGQGEEPSNLGSALVNFEAGARSAWHTHPKGQLLVITEGSGLVQEWGKPVRKIQKGDVVWTPANVKHWHGASSETSMTHLAVQESFNGSPVNWMEKVTDEQYKAVPQ